MPTEKHIHTLSLSVESLAKTVRAELALRRRFNPESFDNLPGPAAIEESVRQSIAMTILRLSGHVESSTIGRGDPTVEIRIGASAIPCGTEPRTFRRIFEQSVIAGALRQHDPGILFPDPLHVN